MVRDGYSFLFKIRQNKTLLEGKRYKNTTLSYNEKIGGILQLLGGNYEDLPDIERLNTVYEGNFFVIFSM